MESFLAIQEDISSKMYKAKSNLKKAPKERLTHAYLETRIENLEQLWSTFTATHKEIISTVKKVDLSNSSYIKNGLYDEVEEFYVDFKSELRELLSKGNSMVLNEDSKSMLCHSEKSFSRVKLPEIKIPSFSGKYSEWQTFRDLFFGLVHENPSLDDAQRFYYLKGHLSGEAEQLLRNIKVTSENYKIAWSKLDKMYNNKKFIANGIMKRLLSQKTLSCESAIEIKRLLNTTSECLESIRNLGVDVSSWDLIVVHIISEKLDKETRKVWELKVASDLSDELPTFIQFSEFLNSRFRGLENLDTFDNKDRHPHPKRTQSFHVSKDKKSVSCEFCSADHKITSCPKFRKESNETRRNFVQEHNLCFVCLYNNHSAKNCKNTLRCQVCKRRHHTLLHPQGEVGSEMDEGSRAARAETSSVNNEKIEAANKAEEPLVSCLATGHRRKTVLLTTALVQAESKNGTYCVVRALLDQGSQGSFITESTVQYLRLNKIPSKNTVLGVGGSKSTTSTSMVVINLRSRVNPSFQIKVKAHVLKSVTALLPSSRVSRVEWVVDLSDNDLADPQYFKPNKIDILLGAEVFSQIIQNGVKKNSNGTLLAQETTLGWILSGSFEVDNKVNTHSQITVMHASVQDDELLRKFWELEEPSRAKRMLTEDEIYCERLFTTSTTRNKDGRYIVRLPLREPSSVGRCAESKVIAAKRLKGLEVRLGKNNKLKADYANVMQEYLKLNHMAEVTEQEKYNKEAVYLPHHAVIREDKDTTKVRVVFDASCKGTNGRSLNDDLMIGPPLQDELRHTVMRWRVHKIGIVADIVKMYRQVLVDRQDTPYQRILWRDSHKKELKEYELLTVTFGTASAPYLAVRALQQLAYDECGDNSSIANIILKDFYMDDLMSGSENIEDGFKNYTELSQVLAKGGFKLQKWKSNCKELLNKIKDGNDEELIIKIDEVTKILGLTWDARDDCFRYSLELTSMSGPVTKRKIISEISRLFDPLGWLAPSVVLAKMLIQKLWLAGLEWDQEIPNNLLQEWDTYRNSLASLVSIKIPRWLHIGSNIRKAELHGFSDASKNAYAGVVYLRVIDDLENIHISLVTSKTKVAPIRQVSIPRLELCGAVLLAKLMAEVGEVMGIQKLDWHAWTDSEVVLAWLNSHPSRWKTFVGNRVSDILNIVDTYHWSHVSSKHNPADCASRGVSPAELNSTGIWWNGPDLLRRQIIEYKRPKHLVTHIEEVKVHTNLVEISFWDRFSSLSRMIRVVAYCRKFLHLRSNCSDKERIKQLSTKELEEAMDICIRKGQEEELQEEIQELKKMGSLGTTGRKYKSLNLFLDTKGIIRVGGRLELSQLSYDRKHPILIPKDAFLTKHLVSEAHQKTMHGGPQAMMAYLRSRYWVVGVKSLVKAYFRKCVTCVRYTNKARSQLMGQLPSPRVTPNKAFLYSGVDYAGPINVRMSKGRGNKSYKGYIALFVCLSTRAVHIEAVSDMTSKGFLAAFKRFVARRGHCAELHSDNGTNFVGAARELQELFKEETSNFIPELVEALANNGTKWNFIPPHAPNFGGLWEAGIKSTKYHLKRVVGNSTLTFEELTTVLAQIEACLNSRPLSCVDQNELTVLTPGHFLVGEPLVLAPDSNFEKVNISGLGRWQLTQRMLQDYWRRWSQDYLNQFLQRHKWAHQTPEPAIGDIVLIKEDDLPPGKWLLGKIESKHPGPDGITRVVTVKTKNSLIKRPVSKLAILPVAT